MAANIILISHLAFLSTSVTSLVLEKEISSALNATTTVSIELSSPGDIGSIITDLQEISAYLENARSLSSSADTLPNTSDISEAQAMATLASEIYELRETMSEISQMNVESAVTPAMDPIAPEKNELIANEAADTPQGSDGHRFLRFRKTSEGFKVASCFLRKAFWRIINIARLVAFLGLAHAQFYGPNSISESLRNAFVWVSERLVVTEGSGIFDEAGNWLKRWGVWGSSHTLFTLFPLSIAGLSLALFPISI
jgi:hypothetical protein